MWYEQNKETPDYNKPIFAIKGGRKYILLPQIEKKSYEIIGYNWFDIENGDYNSNTFFKTPQAAINSYKGDYKIANAEIDIMHINFF